MASGGTIRICLARDEGPKCAGCRNRDEQIKQLKKLVEKLKRQMEAVSKDSRKRSTGARFKPPVIPVALKDDVRPI